MNEGKKSSSGMGETIITAISIGFFLVLVGILFVITPNLFGKIIDLLSDFKVVEVVPNSNIMFLGPESPSVFSVVYVAAAQFSFALGVFQVFILALRFFYGSPWRKRAETVGNMVFWLGTGFLIQSFLIGTTQWFVYWSTVIMMIGVSLLARAGVMAVSRIA